MNCLSQVRSYITVAVFNRKRHFITRSSLNRCYYPHWKSNVKVAGITTVNLELLRTQLQVLCYSTRRKAARPRKLDSMAVVENEKDAFFVMRKGDTVGVYKSLSDCQAQVGSSVFDAPVSVYKGYSLSKDAEEHLASCGLKNAIYSINAADLKEDLFGVLTPCLLQEQTSSEFKVCREEDTLTKIPQDTLEAETRGEPASASMSIDPLRKLESRAETSAASSDRRCCIIEFDGASKGNPGQAGAAAVLRTEDGSLICKLRQGLGRATNNAAEYQGVILGLTYALEKGYTNIRVKGDSKLVCMQMQGLWKVRHQTMSELYKEAKKLKDKCVSFEICHVLRGFNSDADAQANLAVRLAEGQIQVE